ncbi:pyridoxal phosphate-dependent decarboxylase family protein [Rhodotorula paludigena]|uniref:pyridoxal phosphate-dependent decarboxylase family protein n=1 Tax=Rhodotorula paludigena TaxID=86838 RepID=UPI00316CA31F
MPGQAGPRCYGLVLGGVTPAAQLADMLVTSFDPCVQVHWPEQTVSVALEALTLSYLLSLLSLPSALFTGNALTTGATASNLLGLCLGRDWTVARIQRAKGHDGWSVPEDGLGGVAVDVFVVDAHASIKKAAAMAGLGRRAVVDLRDAEREERGEMDCFDLTRLEERLRENEEKGRGSIVATSFGEVNTGAINPDTPALRALCDRYHAWLHIDAAFGAFAILHPDYKVYVPHLALGDSITSDAHKWLNVPYDCGLFFSRAKPIPGPAPAAGSGANDEASLIALTGPGANAPAYLTAPAVVANPDSPFLRLDKTRAIPSPLFTNVENSRRFRALPVYASLLSLGRDGYAALIERNIAFARRIDAFLRSHPSYDVLTPTPPSTGPSDSHPFAYRVLNVVLFAPSFSAPARFTTPSASNLDPGATFLRALNGSNEIFVTGTNWRGRAAVRLAVSNWATEIEEGREWEVVKRVLEGVMRE